MAALSVFYECHIEVVEACQCVSPLSVRFQNHHEPNVGAIMLAFAEKIVPFDFVWLMDRLCWLWGFDGCFKSFRVLQVYQSTQPSPCSRDPLTHSVFLFLPQATLDGILFLILSSFHPTWLSQSLFDQTAVNPSFWIVFSTAKQLHFITTRTTPNKGFRRNGYATTHYGQQLLVLAVGIQRLFERGCAGSLETSSSLGRGAKEEEKGRHQQQASTRCNRHSITLISGIQRLFERRCNRPLGASSSLGRRAQEQEKNTTQQEASTQWNGPNRVHVDITRRLFEKRCTWSLGTSASLGRRAQAKAKNTTPQEAWTQIYHNVQV